MEGPHGREKTAASPESIAQRPPSPTAVTPVWRRWSRGKWGVGDGGVEAMTVGQRGGKGGGKEGQRAGNVGVKAVESGKVRGSNGGHGGCDGCTAWGKRGGARRSAGDGGVEAVRLEGIGEKGMGEVGGGGSADMKITYLSSECSRGTMRKKSSLDILNSGVVVVVQLCRYDSIATMCTVRFFSRKIDFAITLQMLLAPIGVQCPVSSLGLAGDANVLHFGAWGCTADSRIRRVISSYLSGLSGFALALSRSTRSTGPTITVVITPPLPSCDAIKPDIGPN
ncbi:hypothetical protein OsJ_28612 [Oryza sativa Japonica Group]|uniref:Uncharacterized protein n=1 Tax=Oryza sativa subsp. japonica TaxID=39947 RepID=Q6H4T1_ORYSJ|nr:hypothetical protein OsJ_28612 [Oryza sativa Japonica Group]BAD26268.1 hypothetical protein [Oryza sativa Japonica Group]